jgi:hypothetical protein
MKVFWYQGGLFAQPENEKDSIKLSHLADFLEIADFNHGVVASPIANLSDKNSVIGVHKFS